MVLPRLGVEAVPITFVTRAVQVPAKGESRDIRCRRPVNPGAGAAFAIACCTPFGSSAAKLNRLTEVSPPHAIWRDARTVFAGRVSAESVDAPGAADPTNV